MAKPDSDKAAALRASAEALDRNESLTKPQRSQTARVLREAANRFEPATATVPHSPDVLEDAAKHVTYEIAMLRAITDLIQAEHFRGDVLGQNLLTEGGLLHARVLDDFFRSPRRPQPDDVIALDFTPRWRPESVFELSVDRVDVNKKLAHLTTQRREERGWKMAVYWVCAAELLIRLIDLLPPDQAKWFTDPTLETTDDMRARAGAPPIDGAPLISAALKFRAGR